MSNTTIQSSGIRSVASTVLHVEDLPRMVRWYGEILNMPIAETDSQQPFYVFDMANGVNLMLDDHRFMKDQKKFPICMMKTADIEQSYAWAKQNKIPIVLDMQHVHEGLDYFNIQDSEGNVIMAVYSTWVNPHPIRPNRKDHPVMNLINSIVVPVTDLKRATEWYARLLSQAIKPERQDGGPIYWFDMDNGTGILLDDNRSNRDFGRYPTFMLKTPDVHEAYRFLKDKGVRILRDIEFEHHFFIADPEGNSIIICLG